MTMSEDFRELEARLRKEFPDETWAIVPGYDGNYLVSDNGKIYSKRREKVSGGIRKQKKMSGYWFVCLKKGGIGKTVSVSRAMLISFVGEPNGGEQCAHLNGICTDNRLANLKWCSPAENTSHKESHGTMVKGEKSWNAVLTAEIVRDMRKRAASGESPSGLFIEYGITRSCGKNALYRRSWKHV
jgi:hypothetical protein